ncbi:hypothetical protein FHG66_00970 [Rubellimicrobium rubrum]|uniref:Uncharacterized protein n=1 Tax=Rubellimicrobium rubrum TaxID=2585369 RepID=A0A5C4N2G1_9RHOB|nr:hypothetical protein [Rubellimicrobium rubrum]TNC52897.1 hypothetical protein FHG66_00970 [Rubellimicrobium rubrum]
MDISVTSVAPRHVADLRPTADAAATARITAPPLAIAQAPVVAPASPQQGALVVKGLIEAGVAVGSASGATATETKNAPPRVLKPFGLHMLPYNEPRHEAAERQEAELAAQLEVAASKSNMIESEPQETRSEDPVPRDVVLDPTELAEAKEGLFPRPGVPEPAAVSEETGPVSVTPPADEPTPPRQTASDPAKP